MNRTVTLVFALVAGLAACAAPPSPQGQSVVARLPEDLILQTSLHAGYRSIEGDQTTIGDHALVSLELDGYRLKDPVGLEVGVSFTTHDDPLGSVGDGIGDDLELLELYGGLRKTFGDPDGAMRTYLGLGGTFIDFRRDVPGMPTSDATGAGGYARAGVIWTMGLFDFDGDTKVNFGFDVRGVISDDFDFVQGTGFLSFGG